MFLLVVDSRQFFQKHHTNKRTNKHCVAFATRARTHPHCTPTTLLFFETMADIIEINNGNEGGEGEGEGEDVLEIPTPARKSANNKAGTTKWASEEIFAAICSYRDATLAQGTDQKAADFEHKVRQGTMVYSGTGMPIPRTGRIFLFAFLALRSAMCLKKLNVSVLKICYY
jgi:hypothetical protein